jgi:DNA mismatch endonuclease (patch repair protein)
LPGHPDIVFPSRQKIIFVHGCFWHRHTCPLGDKLPISKPDYWGPKLERNKARDARNIEALHGAGWSTLIVWECQIASTDALERALQRFLG